MKFSFPSNMVFPKQTKLVEGILEMIQTNDFQIGSRLPSINEMVKETGLSRDTVIAAYRILQEKGVVKAVHGSGFFVASLRTDKKPPLFLFFDVMNSYKEVLYRSFVNRISEDYECDIFFHYYNPKIFRNLIEENLSRYAYYVVMPHFNLDVSGAFKNIPANRLLLIDAIVPRMKKGVPAVYQPFEKDMINSLELALESLRRYKRIFLMCDNPFQFIPDGMKKGFITFCENHKFQYGILQEFNKNEICKGDVYIAVADADLVNLIKLISGMGWELGKDIGLISYDETPLKEVLAGGISVISTDFEGMGKTAARLILEKSNELIENPCNFIRRISL